MANGVFRATKGRPKNKESAEEAFDTPQEIKDKVDAIKKRHAPQRTPEYLEGRIKEWEEVMQMMGKNLEDVKKLIRRKIEELRIEIKLRTEAKTQEEGL